MIKEPMPGFYESDNPDYVLTHKCIIAINGFAFGIAVGYLAQTTGADFKVLAEAINNQAEVQLGETSREEIEEMIKQVINKTSGIVISKFN